MVRARGGRCAATFTFPGSVEGALRRSWEFGWMCLPRVWYLVGSTWQVHQTCEHQTVPSTKVACSLTRVPNTKKEGTTNQPLDTVSSHLMESRALTGIDGHGNGLIRRRLTGNFHQFHLPSAQLSGPTIRRLSHRRRRSIYQTTGGTSTPGTLFLRLNSLDHTLQRVNLISFMQMLVSECHFARLEQSNGRPSSVLWLHYDSYQFKSPMLHHVARQSTIFHPGCLFVEHQSVS